uniref:Uncharacterized protein n=1 Tax=Glossina austeni TaxID=7395 RepID=A0A1A9VHW4_GLOAU
MDGGGPYDKDLSQNEQQCEHTLFEMRKKNDNNLNLFFIICLCTLLTLVLLDGAANLFTLQIEIRELRLGSKSTHHLCITLEQKTFGTIFSLQTQAWFVEVFKQAQLRYYVAFSAQENTNRVFEKLRKSIFHESEFGYLS